MPTVWVTGFRAQAGLEAAERFGELRHLFEGSINVWELEVLAIDVKKKMEECSPVDMFILCGSMHLAAHVQTLALAKWGTMNVLVFDKRTQDYELQTITAEMFGMKPPELPEGIDNAERLARLRAKRASRQEELAVIDRAILDAAMTDTRMEGKDDAKNCEGNKRSQKDS